MLDLEPIDQLDGFLVARLLQNKTNSNFYPFIAGVYEIFNCKSSKEISEETKRKIKIEREKRNLLENIIRNLQLNGKIYTTYDLFNDEVYWEIFKGVIKELDPDETRKKAVKESGMLMREFPREFLGKGNYILGFDLLKDWYSSAIYIPAEITEALWFKERLNVAFKIGPFQKERIYDEKIFSYDMGIIGLKGPKYLEKAKLNQDRKFCPAEIKDTVPYIGKRNQNRITFSDNPCDIGIIRNVGKNPSYERALLLSKIYSRLSGIPLSQSSSFAIYQLCKLGRSR
jgi:hypothetical protein